MSKDQDTLDAISAATALIFNLRPKDFVVKYIASEYMLNTETATLIYEVAKRGKREDRE